MRPLCLPFRLALGGTLATGICVALRLALGVGLSLAVALGLALDRGHLIVGPGPGQQLANAWGGKASVTQDQANLRLREATRSVTIDLVDGLRVATSAAEHGSVRYEPWNRRWKELRQASDHLK